MPFGLLSRRFSRPCLECKEIWKVRQLLLVKIGSGTNRSARFILKENGISEDNSTFLLPIADQEAARRLMAGEIDVMMLLASPKSDVIAQLLQEPNIGLKQPPLFGI